MTDSNPQATADLSDAELDVMAAEWTKSYAQSVSREDVRAALQRLEVTEQERRRAQWEYQMSPNNPWLQDGSPLPWRYRNGKVMRVLDDGSEVDDR